MTGVTRLSVRVALLALLCLIQPQARADHPNYTLGIFPHLSPLQIEQRFDPIAKALEREIHGGLRVVTSSTMDRFLERLHQGEFDIAFIQPFDYLRIANKGLYRPMARVDAPLQALFLVRPDSTLHQLSDLSDRRIAMPQRNSAISRLATSELLRAGTQTGSRRIVYAGSHSSCIQMLFTKRVDSCATVEAVAERISEQMGRSYRVIHRSNALPHAMFAISTRLPESLDGKLTHVMEGWSQSAEGRALLAQAHFKGFVAASDRDYDPVRRYAEATP